jgi:hypothetical protein
MPGIGGGGGGGGGGGMIDVFETRGAVAVGSGYCRGIKANNECNRDGQYTESR